MRFDRPIGIYLLLWPVLWALWIAATGVPDNNILLIFVSGVVVMRAFGCVLNDYIDRDIDRHIERTKKRPLVIGTVRCKEAKYLLAVLLLIAFRLVFLLPNQVVHLAVVGAVLTTLYPFCKRYTYLPQFVLGICFAWSVPMAFAAQGHISQMTWVIFFAVVLWVMIFDTMYAMADKEDDIKFGIKSTAILFADADRFIIGMMQVLLLAVLLLIGVQLLLGYYYYLAVGIVGLLFIYQQHLIYEGKPEHCLQAFCNHHWVGLAVFVGLFLSYAK